MSMLTTVLMAVLGLMVLAVGAVIGIYNRLVALRQRYKNAFAQIDVQLKRRFDLIPNLVETVKAYMKHEQDTLEAVIQARNMALAAQKQAAAHPGDAGALGDLGQASGLLESALGRLFALSEAYPELRSNENMMQLTEELTTTENKVAFARQAYNDSVTRYNTAIESFPAVVMAHAFGFRDAALFEVERRAELEAAPEVKF